MFDASYSVYKLREKVKVGAVDLPKIPRGATTVQLSTEDNKVISTGATTEQLTVVEVDKLFELLQVLVNTKFKGWYCKRFKQIGKERTLRYAAIARADSKKDPRKYFSWLLKHDPHAK